MARIVFILGAGASAMGKCPVSKTFLQAIRHLALTDTDGSFAEDFKKVDLAQRVLQGALVKSTLDTDNIESLFSALELSQLIGRLGDLGPNEIATTIAAFKRLIARTIDRTQQFTVRRASNENYPIFASGPPGYIELASVARTILSETSHHSFDFITFNYDMGLDVALLSHGIDVDYGFGNDILKGTNFSAKRPLVHLCKLHGSLNWMQIDGQQAGVQFVDPLDILARQLEPTARHDPLNVQLNSFDGLRSFRQRKGLSDDVEALLIPPTESKSQYRKPLSRVWASADRILADADIIVVCGYSLPESDYFFKTFFALSMNSRTVIRKFRIVDLDPSPVESRFRSILGPSITLRQEVLASTKGNLQTAVDIITDWYSSSSKLLF